MLKRLCVAMAIGMLVACSPPALTFKASERGYSKSFDEVWTACLAAVDDYTIESASKESRQIVTKPASISSGVGYKDRYVTIKVSPDRPYRVQVMATAQRRLATVSAFGAGQASGNSFSDEEEEQRIIDEIDKRLR